MVLLGFLAATILSIALDLPFLRQLLGILFLAVVPGLLVVYNLRIRTDAATGLVLSVGISAAFVILFGTGVSAGGAALGISRPLSILPTVASFGCMVAGLAVLAYMRNRGKILTVPHIRLSKVEKGFLIIPTLLPALSFMGTHFMKVADNNVMLLVLFLIAPAYVAGLALWHKKIPDRIYPWIIFMMGISFLMAIASRSNHLYGSDIHDEYRVFVNTLATGQWLPGNDLLDTSLTVSILPSVYQIFLNTNPEQLYMVLITLLFSVSSVVVCIISRRYVGGFYAFLASFLFISQKTFLDSHGRTSMAILFFALAVMVLFHDDLTYLCKRILFMLFCVGIVASHYASAYIFFFLVLLAWIVIALPTYMRKAVGFPGGDGASSRPDSSRPLVEPEAEVPRGITGETVALVMVLLFFWYGQVTSIAFDSAVNILHMATGFHQAFLLETKSATVSAAVGVNVVTIPQRIRVVLSWSSIALIALGVLVTTVKHGSMVAWGRSGRTKEWFLRCKFDKDFYGIALASGAVLVAAVALPYVSNAYDLERTSFIALPVLGTFLIIGGIVLAGWMRVRHIWLLAPLVIALFLSTSGSTYQAFGIPASPVLNSSGPEFNRWYLHERDSDGAKWLGTYVRDGSYIFTGAWPGPRMLLSQTILPRQQIREEYEYAVARGKGQEPDGFIYLRNVDTNIDHIVARNPNIAQLRNKIYSNGASDIYR